MDMKFIESLMPPDDGGPSVTWVFVILAVLSIPLIWIWVQIIKDIL